MMLSPSFSLRKFYGEIVLGYSKSKIGDDIIFIRHFSPIEQGEVDFEYVRLFDEALEEGLIAENDKIKNLIKEGEWTEEEETFIGTQAVFVENLKETKRNLAYASQAKEVENQIVEAESRLIQKQNKRAGLLGLTAEGYTLKRLNEFYIYKSLYKDSSFKTPLFTEEEYDDLDQSQVDALIAIYNKEIDALNAYIKKVALSQFFQNAYRLADNNAFFLYGKPIVALTFMQSELASLASYFSFILSRESKPPEDVAKDPDRLLKWYSDTSNIERVMNKHSDDSNVVAVGATQDDLKIMENKDVKVVSLQQIASDQGKKKLNMEDLMKILG